MMFYGLALCLLFSVSLHDQSRLLNWYVENVNLACVLWMWWFVELPQLTYIQLNCGVFIEKATCSDLSPDYTFCICECTGALEGLCEVDNDNIKTDKPDPGIGHKNENGQTGQGPEGPKHLCDQ